MKKLFSTDHKVIGIQFLWAGLVFLAIGGALAMIMRWQWAYPGEPVPLVGDLLFPGSGGVVTPAEYAGLFSNHGLVMIFFAVTPILIGCFGNFLIPLLCGARDMAFPRLNALSFWTFLVSQVLALVALVLPETPPAAGWTMYAPLSTGAGSPGAGLTLMVVAIFVTGAATVMGAVNYVTTVITHRAPGMSWMRMPLTLWGLFLTAVLNVLFVPVLSAATMLLFLDRVAGTAFFSGIGGGDPILYQHLFWIFGHPEVYILILPVWGIVGDLVSFFSRKPAFWYRGSVFSMIAITVMSGMVYGHHMFQTGIGPMLGASFEVLTLAISAPAVILAVNWLATLWQGAIRLTVPMLFCLGTIAVFGLGGLTALPLGAITTDVYLHDTMWVVGHFHLIMAAATLMGSFAAIYFWFPKLFGRMTSRSLGVVHFAGTFLFSLLTFGGQLLSGYGGQLRRLADPQQVEFLANLEGLNRHTSFFAFALGAFQVFFVINFFRSLFVGERAEKNPWRATTLEWMVSSPPPRENFEEIPGVRRGPHELGNPEVQRALGRDFLDQTEAFDEK